MATQTLAQLVDAVNGLAEQSGRLAVVRSMATREGAHDRARYLLHTGYAPTGTVRLTSAQ